MTTDTIPQNDRMYPSIEISRIKNPNRFYAIPIIGLLIKILMLIPVWIELAALGIADFFILFINSFIVLFTGNYWKVAYDLNVALIRISIKVSFFITGLTNTYPGFSLHIDDAYTVTIPYNRHPSRLFAIPLLGGLARIIILIPFLIFSTVISYASNISIFASWIPVLFTGYYPETTFEITRDSSRVSQATSAYMAGLSDTYPAFWISMNHKTLKIILITLGTLALIWNNIFKNYTKRNTYTNRRTVQQYMQQYMQQLTPTQIQSSPYSY